MDEFRNKNNLKEHDWLHVSFLLSNIIIYVAMVIFNALASIPGGSNSNIF